MLYDIQSGDNLGQIAQTNKTDVQTILDLNKNNPAVRSKDLIFAGGKLVLPDTPATPTDNTALGIVGGGSNPGFSTSDSIRAAETQAQQDQAKKDAEAKAEADRLKTQTDIATMKNTLAGGTVAPATPNLTDTYKGLLAEKDVSGFSINDYQTKIADLSKQKDALLTQFQTLKKKLPEGVSQDYASAAISKEGQAVQDQIDFIDRQINTYNTQIKNRNDVVSTIMDLTKTDFANASDKYDRQFNQNLAIYNAVQGKADKAATLEEKQVDNARANLTIIQNELKTGNMNWDSLPADKKNVIQGLEIQAGFPPGFTSFLTKNVKGDVVASNSRTAPDGTTYFDVLTRNPDGSFGKISIAAGQSKGTSGSENTILTKQQYTKLSAVGIDQSLADKLAKLEILGVSPKDITAALQTDNIDPKVYDTFLAVYKP